MKKGFTLIEILIVVAIIAILASVVLVGLGPTQRLGRDARRLSDLRQTQNALELYYNKCGFYPGSGTSGTTCPTTAPTAGAVTWSSLTTSLTTAGLGIPTIPNDPSGGRTYSYGITAGGVSYVLAATLENNDNQVLKDDLDGTNFSGTGVDCGTVAADIIYCLAL